MSCSSHSLEGHRHTLTMEYLHSLCMCDMVAHVFRGHGICCVRFTSLVPALVCASNMNYIVHPIAQNPRVPSFANLLTEP
ncbi:hypothetical protein Rcae01_00882 [Novipirellula caenicola]|uniref:Uncharacterized protein n=1 Tax=Novipirellula caenicola TaxID=1536901 RepID=A0ABP9VJQ6_9BACT